MSNRFQSFSAIADATKIITIIEARIVCYAPNDFGIMYQFSDGGIGGRSIGSFDEALEEVNRINGGSAAVQASPPVVA
jgi:hypothetical protein